MSNTLNISEHFYSVQCEGASTGYPAYFIRLMNCNLSCGASRDMLRRMKQGLEEFDPGDFMGDLHQQGKATWTCDTLPVWINGGKTTYQQLYESWMEQHPLLFNWIMQGRVHLIWTGGEPTIRSNANAIVGFIDWCNEHHSFQGSEHPPKFYNEIETNGTGYIEDDLFKHINQINCSVKLANSGMEKDRRIVPRALKRIMQHSNYWFKFVISNEEDLQEIETDFIKPFNIPATRVILMPGLDAQKNFHERTKFSLEMAKKYGYVGLSRLHVSAWDKTTGV